MRPARHTSPPLRLPPPKEEDDGWLGLLAGFLGAFRWAFLPLGLLSLVAVGIHAAADVLDDRVLALVDRAGTALGSWSWTASWAEAIGAEARTRFARILALAWELSADLLLALPVLGYRERTGAREAPEREALRLSVARVRPRKWPAPFLYVRPLAVVAACLAGSFAVARMVRGAVYLSGQELLGDPLAGVGSRWLAVAVLAAALGTLGWRAALASVRHARRLSREAPPGPTALWHGLPSAVLVSPLAAAALMEAAPILSLLR